MTTTRGIEMDGDRVPVGGQYVATGATGESVATTRPGRRVVLGGALAAGAASLVVAPQASAVSRRRDGTAPTAATPGGDLPVSVSPRSGYRSVPGPRGDVRMPHDLAVVVRGDLRAGTRVTLDVDARVYAGSDTVRVLADGRELAPLTARRTSRGDRGRIGVTLPALAGVREWTLEAGSVLPRRYPDDLVADPSPVVVTVADRVGSRSFTLVPVSAAADLAAPPFGACLGAAWEQVTWGEGWSAAYPRLVTLRSTGPGPLPAGTRIEVALDAQLAAGADLRPLEAQRSPSGTLRKSSGARLTTAAWTLEHALPAGARVDLLLALTPRRLSGAPARWDSATVQVITPEAVTAAQRFTGTESLTSLDDVVTEVARAAARRG